MPPTTPLVADLDPARATSRAAPDALLRPMATMLRALDDETLVEAAMPWLACRLSTLLPSLITTTGTARARGPEDAPAASAARDESGPPSPAVVPCPHEAAAASGLAAAASPTEGPSDDEPALCGPTPRERLLAEEHADALAARERAAADARRRIALARAVPAPAPGAASGAKTEPRRSHRSNDF